MKKSPPAPDQRVLAELNALAGRLDQQQLWWASGYLAGLAAAAPATAAAPQTHADAPPQHVWTVLYGTETGNCRAIADELAKAIRASGAEAEAIDLAGFKPALLRKQARALFVVATHGLGEPPDGTEGFFEFLLGDRAPRLEQLGYSVLALGDSSYEDFCATGRQLDARLEALGARRLAARVDCDVDFETGSEGWQEGVLELVRAEREAAEARPAEAATPHLVPVTTASSHSRRNPFLAPVLEVQRITGAGSSKDVRHVVLSLEGSGLTYEPGDALGVWPTNPPALVARYLTLTGLDGDSSVDVDGEPQTLREALSHRLELTLLGRGFLETYATAHAVAPLLTLLEPQSRDALNAYLDGRQVIDVLREHPVALSAQQLVDSLKRITPRLYSISSSLDANPDEVHVTVALVRYTAFGEPHLGSASNYLGEPGDRVPVYIAPNPRFRLPEDAGTPTIMIGAGTGVAPFRAFLEERDAAGATGDNWLFFGDRNFASDFLYQVEWARLRAEGLLTRHDVAFSRDQTAKVYVQDRIRERGPEVFQWLERGAHVYVCGDAKHMAPDVHEALLQVIADALGDAEAAEAYLRELKKANRYQRDVY